MHAFIKATKIWWIFGIIYTLVFAGHYIYLGDYSQVFRAVVNGIGSVLGLIVVTELEKRL